uniref:Uncharacterized protein n=1 Tax=Leersia perrieri TaxID=77586 RepID=A0A0D9XB47_9ORYZ
MEQSSWCGQIRAEHHIRSQHLCLCGRVKELSSALVTHAPHSRSMSINSASGVPVFHSSSSTA